MLHLADQAKQAGEGTMNQTRKTDRGAEGVTGEQHIFAAGRNLKNSNKKKRAYAQQSELKRCRMTTEKAGEIRETKVADVTECQATENRQRGVTPQFKTGQRKTHRVRAESRAKQETL